MTPLGWRWAGFVWVYALAWFSLNDRVNCSPIGFLIRLKHPRQPRTQSILHRRLLHGLMNSISSGGRGDGKANQDWLEAERETRKNQVAKKDVCLIAIP